MKKILLALVFCLAGALPSHAQIYDVACPAGTNPLGQAINESNGHLKAYLCLDAFGNVTSPGATGLSPISFNVKAYGAIGDAKKSTTSITTNTSSSVTDSKNVFSVTDIGKKIFCIGLNGNSALTTTIATISTFISSTSITVNTTGNSQAQNPSTCIWFTQKETNAFQSASTAANATSTSTRPAAAPTLSYPAAVTCPPGGYVVDSSFFIQNSVIANTNGVSFLGAGRNSCIIYTSPDINVSGNSWLVLDVQNNGFTFSGFTVDCSLENISLATPALNFNLDGNWTMRDVEIDGCGSTGDATGILALSSNVNSLFDDIVFNNAPVGAFASHEPPIAVTGSGSLTFRQIHTTNPSPVSIQISTSGSTAGPNAGGPRNLQDAGINFEHSIFDEGTNQGCMNITGSSVNWFGVTCLDGTTQGVSVDANSSLYLTDSVIGPFNGGCSGGSRQGITLATTGYVYATGSDIMGCGSDGTGLSAAIKGTSAGTFVSAGGNTIRNCVGTLPCPLVTIANFGTQAFNGGIVPKSSETHNPNTCYAVTGNLLATAQNICIFLLDQNYQLLNIVAQSGGTTPANSACATPPVITLSDGTRSATMTMTSGKTAWNSSVDATTNINQVFASGATLTVSIGANTCATPPVNVAVSYVLQSVLNP